MKPSLLLAAGALAFALFTVPANAIDVQDGGPTADAFIGAAVTDEDDVVVKPCDCEPVANPGQFRVRNAGGSMVRIHYEVLEGFEITTTDGTVVGTIASVQNISSGNAIVLMVNVTPGLLGEVDRIAVRRTGFYWTGSAAVIDTTIDDLRASIRGLGLAA
ncbi:MAG: hypothetical protein AB7O56_10035 [Bauldia sp.]